MTTVLNPASPKLEEFYSRLLERLSEKYPTACGDLELLKTRLSPNLLSCHVLSLPKKLKSEAEEIVRAFWALRSLPKWQAEKAALDPVVKDPGHSSVLMSYDFHVDDQGQLRLIEINTNASMSLLAEVQQDLQQVENPFSKNFSAEILQSFAHEAGSKLNPSVAIIDEKPETQRMYIEFLMYRELFENAGWPALISDTGELKIDDDGVLQKDDRKVDLVYNRNTDFYLQGDSTRGLHAANARGTACVTPNPFEYRLLADKERLLELCQPGAIDELDLSSEQKSALAHCLIRTLDVQKIADPEEFWKDRKRWFFKPMRSFGSKAAYRGSSVTKRVWAQILEGEYVAQEYVPAPAVVMDEVEFKYDLRFYVYEDRIQIAAARLYIGQTTNSQTPGGGLTPIKWV